MLLNDFYKVNEVKVGDASGKTIINARITINKSHAIFEGHFPGQPIVPGVCMIEIVKETLENHLASKLFFTSAGNIKFLSFINPEVNTDVHVEIIFTPSANSWDADAKLYSAETTFFKVRGIFSSSLS